MESERPKTNFFFPPKYFLCHLWKRNNEVGKYDVKIDAILPVSKLTWQANVHIHLFAAFAGGKGGKAKGETWDLA